MSFFPKYIFDLSFVKRDILDFILISCTLVLFYFDYEMTKIFNKNVYDAFSLKGNVYLLVLFYV